MLVATKRESRRDAKHKRVMFVEIAEMRDLTIHTGGRRKASHEDIDDE